MTPRRHTRLRSILERRQPDLTVLMDDVHKPHNVSAVIRTCDAVGVFEIHAVSSQPEFAPRHMSAGGSGRWVGVRLHPRRQKAVEALHRRGFEVLAAHLAPGAVDFREVDYTRPVAILLGAEKEGVSRAAQELVDGAITIPMVGAVESLNVSVAAAVILYEAQRQRAAAGFYDQSRLEPELFERTLFEWGYPRLAEHCRQRGAPYPRLGPDGSLLDPLP